MNEDGGNFKGREFICSCSKSYLSYAALFTHIKQKHEGKAPGPIVRPRSQRKRGRPRKNPQAESGNSDSESEKPHNENLKYKELINPVQKKQQQQKTKKAAQLLGCGGFVAFTAYKPDLLRGSPKKHSQSGRKNVNKKGSNDRLQRKYSQSVLPSPLKEFRQQNRLIQPDQEKESLMSFCQNLEIINKCELKKLFCPYSNKENHLPLNPSEFQSFKKFNINFQRPQKTDNIKQATVSSGLSHFLFQIKGILNQEQETKFQQGQDRKQDNLSEMNYEYQQILVLIGFFLQYLSQYLQSSINQKQIFTITKYLSQFSLKYLPAEIQKHKLEEIDLFNSLNPFKFILFLSNWLVISKIQHQIYHNGPSSEFKIEEEEKLEQNSKNRAINEHQQGQEIKYEQEHGLNKNQNQIEFGIIDQIQYSND